MDCMNLMSCLLVYAMGLLYFSEADGWTWCWQVFRWPTAWCILMIWSWWDAPLTMHLCNIWDVFKRVRGAGLKLKPSKCAFFREKVFYLGHEVSREGVATDPRKIDQVGSWPIPQSAKDVQKFLGLASYYRRFVRDFATIAKPLHRLTEKTATFEWTRECQEAFAELHQKLCTAPACSGVSRFH